MSAQAPGASISDRDQEINTRGLTRHQISFTKNVGQWDGQVLFRANAGGATIWITRNGVVYQFTRLAKAAEDSPAPNRLRDGAPAGGLLVPITALYDRIGDKPDSVEQLVIRASFIGANSDIEVVAEGEMEYRCNYFIGNDPSKWRTDVPNYEAITLHNVYDGIDLCFSGGQGGELVYHYAVTPGADRNQIRLEYDGSGGTSLDNAGRIIPRTGWGEVTGLLASPSDGGNLDSGWISQTLVGVRHPNDGGSTLEKRDPQTIELIYSTYLGGGSWDCGYDAHLNTLGPAIAVDSCGNAYVTGWTFSSDFPTENPYQTAQGNWDAFVTKLSVSGSNLIYSTYLGGESYDYGFDIAVDGSGNAYVTGRTESSNFPTQNPYQMSSQGDVDVFVTKLSVSGNSLIYSTYLGGQGSDRGLGIAIDGNGYAYVSGFTDSGDFPTQNPFQVNQGDDDAFVTKLSISGSSLIYSTYLGGGNRDASYGIAADDSGYAYVTGCTESSDFPTQNPYQVHKDSFDVFVTKLSVSGNSLVYSTYLGGGGDDCGYGIEVDGSGNVYVTGISSNSDFPTQNPYQTYQGGFDAFVTKLSSSGNDLIYSTYLGGESYDYGLGIAVDGSGNAYVTGITSSSDFPTENPYQADQGDWDVFVTKLTSSGGSLIYSTYLGGESHDYGRGIAVDASGNAYATGVTWSLDFPTQNPYQTDQSFEDVFVTKLGEIAPYVCGDADADATVNISDVVHLIGYIFGGGPGPDPLLSGDCDCNEIVNITDAVYLISYIFGGGSEPCALCP